MVHGRCTRQRSGATRIARPTPACSIARSLDVIGDRWTILILRDTFRGIRRFEEIRRDLGIPRAVLVRPTELRWSTAACWRKRQYMTHPPRFEYRLTDMGRELSPVLVGLMQWGDRWLSDGRPADGAGARHRAAPRSTSASTATMCDVDFGPTDIAGRPGPGSPVPADEDFRERVPMLTSPTLAVAAAVARPHGPGAQLDASYERAGATPIELDELARTGHGSATTGIRDPDHLLAEGVHPAHEAVPGPLRLLHLRPAAGPPGVALPDADGGARASPAAGARAGCHEALFTLGEAPEDRYDVAAGGSRSTATTPRWTTWSTSPARCCDETGLLPHANPGALGDGRAGACCEPWRRPRG